jgi:hypothetical protein
MPEIYEVNLKVGPYAEDPVTINFEPTGMSYELVPGDFLTVTIRGPGSGIVEVGYAPSTVIIGAWPEAETMVWGSDGRPLQV